MRQIAVVAPLLILLFFVLYLFTPGIPQDLPPEQFIQQDALVVITQHDLEKRIAEFTESPLGAAVRDIDFTSIAAELHVQDISPELVHTAREQIVETVNDPLFKIIFGRQVSLALVPFSIDPSRELAAQLLEHLLLICRPKHNARFINMIADLVIEKDRITDIPYGVHTIKRLPLDPDRTLSVARVKELFLLSLDERLLRSSLDRYDSGAGALANDTRYWDTRKKFEGASFFSYLNIELLNRSLSENMPGDYGKFGPYLGELEKQKAYQRGYFGAWREQDHVFEKVMISKMVTQPGASENDTDTPLPGIARTLTRVGEGTVLYYWSSHFDMQPLLPYLQAGSGDKPRQLSEGEPSEVASSLGLTDSQIRELAQSEITLALKGITTQQFVPIPFFMIAIHNSNPDLMKQLVDNLVSHYRIPLREVRINGSSGFSWGGVIGGSGLQPTVLFVDDYLVAASNTEQIEEFTSAGGTAQSLVNSDGFRHVDRGLREVNLSVAFLDFAEFAEMLKELASWGGDDDRHQRPGYGPPLEGHH